MEPLRRHVLEIELLALGEFFVPWRPDGFKMTVSSAGNSNSPGKQQGAVRIVKMKKRNEAAKPGCGNICQEVRDYGTCPRRFNREACDLEV